MNARCVIDLILMNKISGFIFNTFDELVLYLIDNYCLFYADMFHVCVDLFSWVIGNFVTLVSHTRYDIIM